MRTVVSVQTSLVCGSIERWGIEEQKQRWLPRADRRRGVRLLRADRARHRLGRRQPAHPGREDRRRLADQRRQDVDLARQRRRGRADLRPDRPGEEAQGPRLLPRPDRVATASPPRRSTASSACAPPTPPRSRSTAVEVGDDALLGEVGDGFKVAMSALDSGRYSVAAGCVGICEGCVQASVAYAKERKQFDVPIASFQLVQEMIADMIVRRDAARMLVRRAGTAQGRGQAVDGRDLDREALRDRVGGRVREPRDPGPRRLRLRRRLPGRALPARRPGDDPLRGHLADPEADHRPRRDRDQRDGPALGVSRWRRWSRPRSTTTSRSAGSTAPRRATRSRRS